MSRALDLSTDEFAVFLPEPQGDVQLSERPAILAWQDAYRVVSVQVPGKPGWRLEMGSPLGSQVRAIQNSYAINFIMLLALTVFVVGGSRVLGRILTDPLVVLRRNLDIVAQQSTDDTVVWPRSRYIEIAACFVSSRT